MQPLRAHPNSLPTALASAAVAGDSSWQGGDARSSVRPFSSASLALSLRSSSLNSATCIVKCGLVAGEHT